MEKNKNFEFIRISRGNSVICGKHLNPGIVYGHIAPIEIHGRQMPDVWFYVERPKAQALRKNSFFVHVWDEQILKFRRMCFDTNRGWAKKVWRWLDEHYDELHDTTTADVAKAINVDYRKTRPFSVYGRTDCVGSSFLRRTSSAGIVCDMPGHKGVPEQHWHEQNAYTYVTD